MTTVRDEEIERLETESQSFADQLAEVMQDRDMIKHERDVLLAELTRIRVTGEVV